MRPDFNNTGLDKGFVLNEQVVIIWMLTHTMCIAGTEG